MSKHHVAHFAGVRRRTLFIAVALMAPLASLGFVSPVLAEKVPTGEYAVFKQCPRPDPEHGVCVYSQATSGVVTLNKLTVPIVNALTLQGAFGPLTEAGVITFAAALNGETLTAVPQPVPGGIGSLINCNDIKGRGFLSEGRRLACKATVRNPRFARVYETTELAGPSSEIYLYPNNTLEENGTAITLPVKFHLENPLLGKNCYVGSNANPIVLHMTTGKTNPPPPNQPTSGHYGTLTFNEELTLLINTEHKFIDDGFAAPGATGCGAADHLIDSKVGLPAPSGYNTVIHEGFTDESVVAGVVASEQEVKEKHKKGGNTGGEGRKEWREQWNWWISRHGRH